MAFPIFVCAQSNLPVYTDQLVNGWQDWGFATENYSNPSPVHSGSDSISVTIASAWEGLQIGHSDLNDTPYASVSFWISGGASGGQQLQVYGLLDEAGTVTAQSPRYYLNSLIANTWQHVTVPLSSLGVANQANFAGFAIQDALGEVQPTFYVDDIQLDAAVPPPSLVHLTVNAGQPVRTADARWFGMNVAVWDSAFDTPQTVTVLTNMGLCALRFPGGSDSDDYHWVYNRQDNNTWSWATSLASFIHVITNVNAQSMITLNYGTGSTNEAAAWVAYVNAPTASSQPLGFDSAGTNWQTAGYWASLRASTPLGTDDGKNFLRISRTPPLGFKYWEIGNEIYGASWETDSNTVPHDPYTYALRARDYISLMKAVDPTIKVGVVVTPGEDSSVNNTNHPVVNPRTGFTHYGWTPVLLATLKSLGVTPDFVIHHRYPQNPGNENDLGLLQSSSGWASDAANLRQQITDYFGPGGTNIELVCTENNSVSSNPGKQSTSLVNGLFMADSLAQLMQTEFNGLFWWNFRNGSDSTTGNDSASLYGWRLYGDYGVLEGADFYPTYYTARLMQNFVRAGDTVVGATSDYSLLSAYAVRRLNGSLTMLVINKDPTNTFTGQITVAGFVPAATATVFSYGIPQDTAAETGVGSADIAQSSFSGTATNFNYVFAPYSETVLALSPAPAKLSAFNSSSNQFVFQLEGQPQTSYVVQCSTNLTDWVSISTNKLSGNLLSVTNSMSSVAPQQFWRAIWQP